MGPSFESPESLRASAFRRTVKKIGFFIVGSMAVCQYLPQSHSGMPI